MVHKDRDVNNSVDFAGYNAVLQCIDGEANVVDFCALLHSFELELHLQIDCLALSRQIKLNKSNLIVKLFIQQDELAKYRSVLVTKKNVLSHELRRLQAAVILYETNEEQFHYYVLMPLQDELVSKLRLATEK